MKNKPEEKIGIVGSRILSSLISHYQFITDVGPEAKVINVKPLEVTA